MIKRRAPVTVALVLAMVGLATQAPRVSFDYDFMAIQGKELRSFQLDEEVNELLGRSQSPVVFPVADDEEENAVSKALDLRRRELGGRSTLDFVVSLSDLVPAGQKDKEEVLGAIAAALRRVNADKLEGDARDRVTRLKRMVQSPPFRRSDLPVEVVRQFRPAAAEGAQTSAVVLAFPRVSQHDGREVRRIAAEVRSVRAEGAGRLRPTAESMILADILEMVIRESPNVLLVTALLLGATLLILIPRKRDSILCLLAGASTVGFTLLALPLAGIELNYLNVVVAPVLFGLGVDGSVHMVSRVRSGSALDEAVAETGRAIFGSLVTTGLGFAALMISDHAGLRSIGAFAVVGIAVNAVVTLGALPALFAWGLAKADAPRSVSGSG